MGFTALDLAAKAILDAAIETEFGIIVRVDSTLRAKAVLYRFRKNLGDPSYSCLTFRPGPDDLDHELWVIRQSPASAASGFEQGTLGRAIDPDPDLNPAPVPVSLSSVILDD